VLLNPNIGQNQANAGIMAVDIARISIIIASNTLKVAIYPSPVKTFGLGVKNIACTQSGISRLMPYKHKIYLQRL
jgi:hypothetical protein